MSLHQQAQLLQWKIKSDFPLDTLQNPNFDCSKFLLECLTNRPGNFFQNAKHLKKDLQIFLNKLDISLQKHVEKDFDKSIKIPGKLASFQQKNFKLQQDSYDFLQKLSLFQSKAKQSQAQSLKLLKSIQQNQQNQKTKENDRKIQLYFNQLSQKVPQMVQVSNRALSSNIKVTYKPLLLRVTKLLSNLNKLIGNRFHLGIPKLKSDFMKVLERQAIAWISSIQTASHFNTVLSCYQQLQSLTECYSILKQKIIIPILQQIAVQASNSDTLDLQIFLNINKKELEEGRLVGVRQNQGLLINSYWTGVMKVLQDTPRLFSPGFYNEYISNFTASIQFIDWLFPSNNFRQSSLFTDFLQKWNLPTYFELRKSDIIKPLCLPLKSDTLSEFLNWVPDELYITSLNQCSIQLQKIPQLIPRIQRLSLQILSTFTNFVSRHLNSEFRKQGTNIQTILNLVFSTKNIYQALNFPVPIIGVMRNMLQEVLEPCQKSLSDSVLKQCQQNLQAIKMIPTTYRMTNRPLPSQPSSFVRSFLMPLKQVSLDLSNQRKVVQQLVLRFLEIIQETFHNMKKSGSLLSKYTSSSEDEQKMVRQIWLDEQAFLEDLETLGFSSQNSEIINQLQLECLKLKTENNQSIIHNKDFPRRSVRLLLWAQKNLPLSSLLSQSCLKASSAVNLSLGFKARHSPINQVNSLLVPFSTECKGGKVWILYKGLPKSEAFLEEFCTSSSKETPKTSDIHCSQSDSDLPGKRGRPVKSSTRIAPKLQISIDYEQTWPNMTSGALQYLL